MISMISSSFDRYKAACEKLDRRIDGAFEVAENLYGDRLGYPSVRVRGQGHQILPIEDVTVNYTTTCPSAVFFAGYSSVNVGEVSHRRKRPLEQFVVYRGCSDAYSEPTWQRRLYPVQDQRSPVAIDDRDLGLGKVFLFFIAHRRVKVGLRWVFAGNIVGLALLIRELLAHHSDRENGTCKRSPTTQSANPGNEAVPLRFAEHLSAHGNIKNYDNADQDNDCWTKPARNVVWNIESHSGPRRVSADLSISSLQAQRKSSRTNSRIHRRFVILIWIWDRVLTGQPIWLRLLNGRNRWYRRNAWNWRLWLWGHDWIDCHSGLLSMPTDKAARKFREERR